MGSGFCHESTTALFVFLHSWSSDYTQDNEKWLRACAERGWIWLHPNFRGINQSPQACGSKFARQDILDAIDHACTLWQVDRERIYLAGVSGGGHMSLLMAGHHPDRFMLSRRGLVPRIWPSGIVFTLRTANRASMRR